MQRNVLKYTRTNNSGTPIDSSMCELNLSYFQLNLLLNCNPHELFKLKKIADFRSL